MKPIKHSSVDMDKVVRDEIASYEYANYNMFKDSFLSNLTIQHMLPSMAEIIDTSAFKNIEATLRGINPAELIQDVLKADGVEFLPDSKITAYDSAVLTAIDQLSKVAEWASKQDSMIVPKAYMADLENALKTLKTPNVQKWQIQNLVVRKLGKIVESLFVNTMNSNKAALSESLCANAVNTSLSQIPAGGLRGRIEAPNKIVTSPKSVNPLVDAVVTINPKTGAKFDINVSLKTSFSPNARYIKGISGSWDSLIATVLNSVSEVNRWGFIRILDYTTTIDSEIQKKIIQSNIQKIVAGDGIDSTSYLVYNNKWYPMSKVVNLIIDNYDKDKTIQTTGALKGFGTPFDAQDRKRFAALGTPNNIKDRAIITYSNAKKMHFGKFEFKWDSSLLKQL